MPTYEITSPDGGKYQVTAPDGASQDQVLSYAKDNFQPQSKGSGVMGALSNMAPDWVKGIGEGKTPDFVKNIGTAAYKGILDLGNSAAEGFAPTGSATRNLFPPPNPNLLFPGTGTAQENMEASGYQPQTPGEKVVNSITRAGAAATIAPGRGIVQTVKNAITGLGAGGGVEAAKSAFGEDSTVAKVVGAILGGLGGHALGSTAAMPWKNTNTIAKDAISGLSTEELQAAQQKMTAAAAAPNPINLNVAQALGKPSNLDSVVEELANSKFGKQTTATLNKQPAQVAAAGKGAVADLPATATNAQDAANSVQAAAGQRMQDLRNYRTQASSPYYNAQKQADLSAMKDSGTLTATQQGVADALATRNSAAQAGGKLTALANGQAETSYYLGRHSGGVGEAGVPPVVVPGAAEGATEAQGIARTAAQKAQGLQDTADALASSPPIVSQQAVSDKVAGVVSKINQDLKLATGDAADTLKNLRDTIAPGGVPLQFPSQIESARKEVAAQLKTNATSTATQKTAAGVLGPYAAQLDSIGQEVSPLIKQGRQVYQQVSQDVVTPAKQSVTGVVAGPKGVPLDGPATATRLSTLFNKGTDSNGTSQIMKLGDDLRTVPGGGDAFNTAAVTHLSAKVQAAIDGMGAAKAGTADTIHASLYGDSLKAQGTKEMLVQVARNKGLADDALYPGFEKVMGYISDAAKRPNQVAGMSRGDVQGAAEASHGAGLLTPFSSSRNAISDIFSKGAYTRIDKLLNTPEGVDALVKLSKDPYSPGAKAAIATALGGAAAN